MQVKTGEPELPVVVEPLQDVFISEGESAVLATQITGNPTPKIVWSRDGKPDSSLPVKVQGETYSLTLIRPTPTDSAQYSVTATNKHGTVTTSCHLSVEGAYNYPRTFFLYQPFPFPPVKVLKAINTF